MLFDPSRLVECGSACTFRNQLSEVVKCADAAVQENVWICMSESSYSVFKYSSCELYMDDVELFKGTFHMTRLSNDSQM